MLLIDDIALQLIGALLTPSLSINATANAVNAATAIDGYLLNVGTPPAGFTN